ncbi:hypothetical protein [Streptomyces sp. NPDC057877]|uniref:hypothetical protein n=1 Tax=Streptomyces sp. NPDC057877 TaxID=3346269 RepID=UPI0036BADA1B
MTRTDERPLHTTVAQARYLVAQFEADGMVQDLMDAVQLLRAATGHRRSAAVSSGVWAAHAECLLRLWEVQGGAGLLREAEEAAGRAVAHPRAVRERAVLARVLVASAADHERGGSRGEALDLLRRADQEYALACAAPALHTEDALRFALERVRTLEEQWRLGGDVALLQSAIGMLEAFADAWPDPRLRPPELPLAHGRVLLRLSRATTDPEQGRHHAARAAILLDHALARHRATYASAPTTGRSREGVRIVLDLVDALLRSGEGLGVARTRLDEALEHAHEQGQRAPLLVRAGHVALARYAESRDPRDLEEAADRFGQAARKVPRDALDHADVLAEWGGALLLRASAHGGAPAGDLVSRTIRVLRDCRAETALDSGALAHRLLLLGRALMLRYRIRGDRVDLREAEHLFGLGAAGATDAMSAARCWLELGQVRLEAYESLGRAPRLDAAIDAFRRAVAAARAAEDAPETEGRRQEAVRLCAQAHHGRGISYQAASRPRAARDAYRAARTEWERLPEDHVDTGEPSARQTAQRLAELE